MLNGISWKDYAVTIAVLVILYYGVVGWMYRKDVLQWLRGRRKE